MSVEPLSVAPGAEPGEWLVAWRITNCSKRSLRLQAARLPHDHFWAEEQRLSPAPTLSAGESARVEREVAYVEEPGTDVQNAFLILRTLWGDEPWRLFIRLRLVAEERGRPRVIIERVSAQPISYLS